MARKRYTAEQIINYPLEAETFISQGKSVAEVSRQIGITVQTYYRWRKEYGGINGAGNTRRTRSPTPSVGRRGSKATPIWDLIPHDRQTGGTVDGPEITLQTKLLGAFPNPFTPLTEIKFTLAATTTVELKVFDVSGRPHPNPGPGRDLWCKTPNSALAGS